MPGKVQSQDYPFDGLSERSGPSGVQLGFKEATIKSKYQI